MRRPVTGGTRITLSYKLYAQPISAASAVMHASSLALQQALKRALADPDFPPEGRSLGFACEHLYPHSSRGFHPPEHLKGRDAMLLAAAESLGLRAEVVPVMRKDYWPYEVQGPQHDEFLTGVAGEMDFRIGQGNDYEQSIDYAPNSCAADEGIVSRENRCTEVSMRVCCHEELPKGELILAEGRRWLQPEVFSTARKHWKHRFHGLWPCAAFNC